MKSVCVVFVCSFLLISSWGMTEAQHFLNFQHFLREHNRLYESESEFRMRFGEFKRNVKKMEEMNKKSGYGVKLGITKFMDWTEEEFSAMVPPIPEEGDKFSADFSNIILKTAPSSYNWNGTWKVRPVQDQGQCGAGWAFAAAGEAEGHYSAIAGLSVQQLIDCDTYDDGCYGGSPYYAWGYIKWDAYGWETDATYPFSGSETTCGYSYSESVYTLSSRNWAWNQAASNIRDYIYQYGPIAASVDSTPLQYYTGGIIESSACTFSQIDHFVLIVGYETVGTDIYWIVKNSWGSSWGEHGFFRIYSGACKIARRVFYSS